MSTRPNEVALTPDRPGRINAGRLQLDLPEGAVHRPVRAHLEEVTPAAQLPPDYELRMAFHLSVIDNRPPDVSVHGRPVPFEFRQPGTVHFSYAGLEHSYLPETTLQLRKLISPEDLWVEVPAAFDRNAKTVTMKIWNEGTYVLVANAGLVPLGSVKATIGSNGGKMTFARLQLDFPAGCFDDDAEITVGPPPPRFESWNGALPFPFEIVAKRKRDGAEIHQLGTPLRLRVAYHDAEIGSMPSHLLQIRHYNEESGWWEPLPNNVVDANAHFVTADTSHLSVFTTGGSTVVEPFDYGTNWAKTNEFTAAATFSMPFELPPGPGGLKPDLKLVYSSQASHWSQQSNQLDSRLGGKGLQSASWVGEGFDIPIGSVNRTFYDNTEHFSVSIFGESFRLVRDGNGVWHTEDEQYWKIDRNGSDGVGYEWRVIKPDGTKYFFGISGVSETDRMIYYDFSIPSQMATRWMLSRIVDTNGNVIKISWARLSKSLPCSGASGTMTPAVYPTEIRYGGNDPNTLPYSIVFNRSSGGPNDYVDSTQIDRDDVNTTGWINDGCTQIFFDVKYLDSIDVKVSGQLARRYKFFMSDRPSIPMMLKRVELWSDVGGTLRQTLLKPDYTIYNDTEYNSCAPGECQNFTGVPYQLVSSLANGFGASYQFLYIAHSYVPNFDSYHGWSHKLYQGRVFVVYRMTVNPGFGGTSIVTDYLHEWPTGNSNWNWPEFKGHGRATTTQAGFQTVTTFYQDNRVGRPIQTDSKHTDGSVVQTTQNVWTDVVVANASHFIRLDRTDIYQQNDRKATRYWYDGYGNQTDIREYNANVSDLDWLRRTRRWFYPVVQANRYIVNKVAAETVFSWDGNRDGGTWQRSTKYCYDNAVAWDTAVPSRGALTAVRRQVNDTPQYQDTTFGYDTWGNRTSQTEWNSYGTSTALASSDGRTTTFEYDGTYHAYKTRETNVLPAMVTNYGYDYRLGRLTQITDPNNAVTVHGYDALGRKIATWLPDDDSGQPGAATVTYRYFVTGATPTCIQVGRRKDNGGGIFGRRAYQWNLYDGLGRLIQQQADFDRSSTKIYAQDLNDLFASVGSGTRVTAGSTRIEASHFTSIRTSIASLWNTIGLGALPNWSSGITPTGPNPGPATPIYGSDLVDLRRWKNLYDAAKPQTISAWSNATGTVIVLNRFYDNRGLLWKESVPHPRWPTVPGQFDSGDWSPSNNPTTTYTYDALKRTLTKVQPDNTSTFSWGYNGWMTTTTDENNRQKKYTNDALGRLVSVQEITSNGTFTTTYDYNVADQLVSVIDSSNVHNHTDISYDKLGQKTDMWDPDLGHWRYEYHYIGTLSKQTDARGKEITFDYDALKRLKHRYFGGTPLTEFQYDDASINGVGRRTLMKFGTSLTNWAKTYYDRRGRVTRSDIYLDGATYTLLSSYDDSDRVLNVTFPNNETITYSYGDHGLPIRLESNLRGTIVANATYNRLGKISDLTLGNGLLTSYKYYGVDYGTGNSYFGLLGSMTTVNNLQSLSYGYDLKGNVTSLVDTRNGNESITFGYDNLDRLTSASSSLLNEVYLFNELGNFAYKGNTNNSYQYPSARYQMGSVSAHTHAPDWVGSSSNRYYYDENGNLVTAEGRTYEYDNENRLARVLEGGSQIHAFSYDGDGVLRTKADAGSPVMHYVTSDYQVNLATGEPIIYYRFGGRAVAWRNNSGLKYLLADHLSSTHGEANESQGELGQRRYYPFGSDRAVTGANDLADEERFTSQKRINAGNGNANRELYYYGARWYLPGVGIFTQPDSIVPDYKNPQALNRYSYAYNNPVKYVDPSGHDPLDWFNEDWLNEFRTAHDGADPQAGDYAYRLLTMLGASGTQSAANFLAGLPQVDYSEGNAALGNPDNETSQTLYSTAEAIDWAALTVTVGTAIPAAILASSIVGAPEGAIVFGVGQYFAFGLSALSFGLTAAADIATERTVPVRASINSNSLEIETRLGVNTSVSGSTLLAGGAVGKIAKGLGKQVAATLAVDAAQVGYDRGLANRIGVNSHYRRLRLQW